MNHARTVDVGGEIPYTIAIGPGLLGDGAALARHVRGRHVLLVSDSVVAPLYAGAVREALHAARPDLAIGTFILPAGEESKTLAHFGHAIEALAALGATREGPLRVLADATYGRVLLAPLDIPLGIATAAIGAPCFLLLLSRVYFSDKRS